MARNKYPEETVKAILDAAERLFVAKGFEKTSMQDIMSATKLSKGAIYHHFVSKEDIFLKICKNKGRHTDALLSEIRDDASLNGREKLKAIFSAALNNGLKYEVAEMQPYLIANPKFLAAQVTEIMEEIAPHYIRPILEQGVADGTISTEYPEQTAELIMLMASLWLNPLLMPADDQAFQPRCEVFLAVLRGIGVDMPMEEIVAAYRKYNAILRAEK